MFGKYELLERINTGGMAETIKARDTGAPGRPIVAVKRVLPHLLQDEQYLTMFRDEARLLARLDHDNVIRTLEVGEVDGCPYAAIEYVHGQDARMLLHQARRGETKIPIRIACYLVAQAALGLHHAHELCDESGTALGLVHRDVSLQNILMSYDGAVKLIDFGIAMAADNVDRTDTGIIKGKFGYMSPEQVRNEPLDRRSDIFALGICLWELLVGERLFPGKNSTETLRRVRDAEIESPRVRNSAIPDALEAITLRALSRHPRDRYQTADDMRRALLAFMAESQNECGSSDLAQYVREVFAEELRKQPSPDVLVSEVARRFDEDSGLAAFDALDPVSTVSALHDQATDLDEGGGVLASVPAPADPPSRSHVAGRPSVPPMVPRAASIPDGYLSWEDVMRGQGNARAARTPVHIPASAPRLRRVTPMPMRADPVSGERPVPRRTPTPMPDREVTPVRAVRVEPPPARRGPQRGALLLALGTAVTLLAVVAVLTFGRTAPATLQLATDPADSIVAIDGARLAADRSPFLITDLAPKVAHEIRVSRDGYRDWSAKLVLQSGQTLTLPLVTLELKEPPTPVEPAAAPSPEPAAPAPSPATAATAPKRTPSASTPETARPPAPSAPKGTGTLRINTRPWAEVHVDGKYVGNTPQTALSLPSGAHVVRLTNPQFGVSKTIRVEIAPGEVVTRVVTLE